MSSVAIIVKSGSGAMRVQAKSLLAIVDRRGMTIGMRPDKLPAWYDIVNLADDAALTFVAGPADGVSVTEQFFMSSGRDIVEAVSVTEASPFSISKAALEEIALVELFSPSLSSQISDAITVAEGFILSSGRDISDSVTVSESFATEGEYILAIDEYVTVAELAVAMIPRGEKYLNGSPINSTTLG